MLELLKLKDTLVQTLSRQRQDSPNLWKTPLESVPELHQLITDLETHSPTPSPLDSPLLIGDWQLIYTTSRGILGLDRIPLTDLGEVYQAIRGDRVYNVAETKSLLGLEGVVAVAARDRKSVV